MKRRYTLWMVVGLMLTVLSGCTNREMLDKLEYLETRMAANADSVREALAAMDGSRLHGEARALHALLYSQALDKCYIDVTNDSTISIATRYYRKGEKPLRAMQALYYHGRIMENAKVYHQAIILYTEAEQYVDRIEDSYIIGLLYAHLGALYSQDYNYITALGYLQTAYEYYKQANIPRLQYSILRNMGHAYKAINDFINAESCLKQAAAWAYANNRKSLYINCVSHLLELYDAFNDSESFFQLYNSDECKTYTTDLNVNHLLARQYALIGESEQAVIHMGKAWEQTRTIEDTISLYHRAYKIYKSNGEYMQALINHEKMFNIQDSLLRISTQYPLIATQRDFYHDQNELIEIKLQKSRQAIFFICVVGVLTIALIIIVSRTRARKKREELEDYMNLNEELKRSIYSKEETISTMGKRLAHLLRGRYELLNELTNTYYETNENIAGKEKVREVKGNAEKMNGKKTDEKNAEKVEDSKESREAIYKKVKTAIDRMAGNRKEMQELESIVNDCCNNVMQYLHEELPELPYDDTVLLCYIYAGFSAKAIHMFTKNSVSNIYSRKSRLRDHIRQSGAPHSQLLLDMMP